MVTLKLMLAIFVTAQLGAADKAEEAKKPADAAELPVVDPFSYTYNPFGKRDPFESYIKPKESVQRRASNNPLLNYDLSKFSLTGIVWGMANPRAIVRDGGGKGHIIRRGTRIGLNRGKVMRILKDRVVIAEEFRDPLGKLIVSEYSMKLDEEENSLQ